MDKMLDVRLYGRCCEVFMRMREYKDKARFDSRFFTPYASQLRLYYKLKEDIKDVEIREQLSLLEKKLE